MQPVVTGGCTDRMFRLRQKAAVNVLDAMPKSAQPAAKKAIQDIYYAEDREHAEQEIKTFTQLHSAKFPKAVKKITDDQDVLLEFHNYPAEHWIHLWTPT